MDDPPPKLVPNYPSGCLLALVLGVLPVALEIGLIALRGRPLNLGSEYPTILFQMLWTAIPFLLLAFLGVRERLPWLVGIVATAILWLLLFVPVNGANIGLGLLMLIAPVPISIAVIVAASRSEWRKG